MQTYKILLVSTPVGSLGSGLGGGVEITLVNIAKALRARWHTVEILAPQGSSVESFKIIEISGEFQIPCQYTKRTDLVTMPKNSVLANMWNYVLRVQENYDLVINFAYDWLPLYLTPFLEIPIAHLISMSSLNDAMDQIIEQVAIQFPNTVAVHSMTQLSTFNFGNILSCLSNGIDLSLYRFCEHPSDFLAWAGRISPENGLEDAVKVAETTGITLKIFGLIQDKRYWEEILCSHQNAPIEYIGFLPTVQLQKELGQCRAILVTPKCIHAYSNVAIEALACGVPVIAYNRGGICEIIRNNRTGWLVEPDNVIEIVKAVSCLHKINRFECRQQADTEYSLNAFGDRLGKWLDNIMA